MNTILYPEAGDFQQLPLRPSDAMAAVRRQQTAAILEAVRLRGDKALREFATQFDGHAPAQWEVSADEFAAAAQALPENLCRAIEQAYSNIYRFHASQNREEEPVETTNGVLCWRKNVPIGKVGLYIPGGTAPLFSTVLMLGIPAQIARCPQTILCTPPDASGLVHPAILFAARLCGIHRVFKIGGAQAIAAMAYGTETVPPVWKIFGPGNPWVTAAKQLVSLDGVAIDLPAGPSEVCVIADAGADPRFVAADLLSQAEHGTDSQVLLITTSADLIPLVEQEIQRQLGDLPRRDIASRALENSTAMLVGSMDEAIGWSNQYAPEHLILAVDDPVYWAARVTNAGSVFLGHLTPESAGDYASGTNHTLPTGGYAKGYSGVSVDSFVKKITFQQISQQGLEGLAPSIIAMANAEGLEAHAKAVEIRINALQ